MQHAGPEFVRQHYCAGSAGPIVPFVQQAAQDGLQPHYGKIPAVHYSGVDFTRRAHSIRGKVDGGKRAELADGFQVRADVSDLRNGKCGVAHLQAGRALLDVNQPVFIAIRQRTQQHAAHHAENGGVHANTEREREGDGGPKRRNPPQ